MRNLFEHGLGADEIDGKEFVVKTADYDLARRKREAESDFAKEKARIRKSAYILLAVAFVLTALSMIPFYIVMRNDGDLVRLVKENTLQTVLFCVLFVSSILFLMLFLIKAKKAPRLLELAKIEARLPQLEEKGYEFFSVPEHADEIEVFEHVFRGKDRNRKIPLFYKNRYKNRILKVFATDNSLCFCDSEVLVEISFSDIKRINKISKNILFESWLKSVGWTCDIYKQYKIRSLDSRCFKTHAYYSIVADKGCGECEIVIPDYEEEVLKKYLQLPNVELR